MKPHHPWSERKVEGKQEGRSIGIYKGTIVREVEVHAPDQETALERLKSRVPTAVPKQRGAEGIITTTFKVEEIDRRKEE